MRALKPHYLGLDQVQNSSYIIYIGTYSVQSNTFKYGLVEKGYVIFISLSMQCMRFCKINIIRIRVINYFVFSKNWTEPIRFLFRKRNIEFFVCTFKRDAGVSRVKWQRQVWPLPLDDRVKTLNYNNTPPKVHVIVLTEVHNYEYNTTQSIYIIIVV